MNEAIKAKTNSPEQTEHLGMRLAAYFRAGDAVLLRGELGAGKTVLVRGIVRGLGSEAHVSSPTFVFIHEYEGPVRVAHVDLYRLAASADADDLGIREYLDGPFVTLVEWPERIEPFEFGARRWDIHIQANASEPEERSFCLEPPAGVEVAL